MLKVDRALWGAGDSSKMDMRRRPIFVHERKVYRGCANAKFVSFATRLTSFTVFSLIQKSETIESSFRHVFRVSYDSICLMHN